MNLLVKFVRFQVKETFYTESYDKIISSSNMLCEFIGLYPGLDAFSNKGGTYIFWLKVKITIPSDYVFYFEKSIGKIFLLNI